MRSFGNIHNPVDMVLGVYFHHCAIAMSCRQIARSGLFLANNGRNPSTGFAIVSKKRARRINALMLTCGHYDGSGGFCLSRWIARQERDWRRDPSHCAGASVDCCLVPRAQCPRKFAGWNARTRSDSAGNELVSIFEVARSPPEPISRHCHGNVFLLVITCLEVGAETSDPIS
jgi:hypothetical protein